MPWPASAKELLPFLAGQPDVTLAYWNRTADKAAAAVREFGGEACADLKALVAWRPTAVLVLTAETCRHEVGTELIKRGARKVFFGRRCGARSRSAAR